MSSVSLNQNLIKRPGRLVLLGRYLRRNPSLTIGLAIMLGLTIFTVYGLLTINPKDAYPLAVRPQQPPSWKYPLGTDFFGRDLYPAMVIGLWQTAIIGLFAGALGTIVGTVLGFLSAYFGGILDKTISTICQILIPIPAFLIHVIIAGAIDKRSVTILTMAFVVFMLAWMGPTLVIRAQVLTMKERQFVSVAKLSGMNSFGIIFREILPNLLPFIAAAFVNQVFQAVFASLYLSVVGLGPLREPLLGNTLWSAQSQAAFFNGWWWWPIGPTVALALILASLALINMGIDELANPRIRTSE